jgi:flavin reductase (DIM6/NTAB) family NADH-FMN oxidoreductase RutF
MKLEISEKPSSFQEKWPRQFQIISWAEIVMAIPQAIGVITTFKENGMPNACPWSWLMYSGNGDNYYAIVSLNSRIHTYKNILRDKDFVVNYPTATDFRKCMDTIKNNADDVDEIRLSGLTVEKAQKVNAPRIKECFMNIECRLKWHRRLHPGSAQYLFTGEVVNIAVDDEKVKANTNGRYGDTGFIYNIHSPSDPATGQQENDRVGKIEPMFEM